MQYAIPMPVLVPVPAQKLSSYVPMTPMIFDVNATRNNNWQYPTFELPRPSVARTVATIMRG